MSPNFVKRGPKPYVFVVNNQGKFSNSLVSTSNYYIRPVINLSSNVIFSGSGTYNDMYEVVE